jgi:glutathione peroxidase
MNSIWPDFRLLPRFKQFASALDGFLGGDTLSPMRLYDIDVKNIRGQQEPLSKYQGKVLLIVNTASKCGFTPQYEGLETVYKQFKERGLEILGFPCDQFGNQEPGTDQEVEQFCSLNYGVSFPMFAKIEVNGPATHPLFALLKKEEKGLLGTEGIKWNFTKFLVDRSGKVVGRYAPTTKPEAIAKDIEALL